MTDHVRKYSAGYILVALWLGSWVLATIGGWRVYQADQLDHGGLPLWWDYVGSLWLQLSFENLASEAWQIWLAVLVFKHGRYLGATEDKPPQDRMQAQITDLWRWERERRQGRPQPHDA